MYERYIKRGFDLTGAITLLILASPLFVVIAVLVKSSGPGPVLFSQERSGKGGRPFRIRKFRSMTVDNNVHDKSKADQMTAVCQAPTSCNTPSRLISPNFRVCLLPVA